MIPACLWTHRLARPYNQNDRYHSYGSEYWPPAAMPPLIGERPKDKGEESDADGPAAKKGNRDAKGGLRQIYGMRART